jgi:signal peptidase I
MKAVYNEGDIVVFKNDDKYNVAIVTNIRKKKNIILGYDIRAEHTGAYVLVQVDKPKSKYSIDSKLTAAFMAHSDEPTKLFIDKSLGHTRGNYSDNVEMTVDHYEKCADFSFPVVGPRSF